MHYAPKHESWFDMAEIEIGIINRQYLGTSTPSKMEGQIAAWCHQGNESKSIANWQFTTADTRIKLIKCIDNGPKLGFNGNIKRDGKRFTNRKSLIRKTEDYIICYSKITYDYEEKSVNKIFL